MYPAHFSLTNFVLVTREIKDIAKVPDQLAFLQSLEAIRSWAMPLLKIIMNETGIFFSRSKPFLR